MKEADKTRFDALLEWAQQHGAELHPSLEIYHDPVSNFSVRVKPSCSDGLQPGFRAVACPVSTTLSYLNAIIDGPISLSSSSPQQAGAFPAGFMTEVPPHVIGRFFLIKEYLKRKDSFWWPYIATLPQPEQIAAWTLPAFWPEEDIAYLEGTNAQFAIEEVQDNVKAEFKQARKILKETDFPNWQDYTQLLYKWAFCIFTSRSFRPSLILSDTAKQHVTPLLPQGCQLDDFSILQPLFDIPNHSMTASYTWDVTSDPANCTLVCRDAYRPGEQIYNNYGLKTNSELLLGYGFMLPQTGFYHNDYVHVRKRQQEDAEDVEDAKPKDFLISPHPMTATTSLVGRSRVANSGAMSRLARLPCFAHFEPALIDDLALAIAEPQQREALNRWNTPDPSSGDNSAAASGPLPKEVQDVVGKIKGTLGAKLWNDWQRVKDPGEYGEGTGPLLPPAENKNQELAVEYKERCEKVLSRALAELMREDTMAGYTY